MLHAQAQHNHTNPLQAIYEIALAFLVFNKLNTI
jgi:hypothetical protein